MCLNPYEPHLHPYSLPTRRSSDLRDGICAAAAHQAIERRRRGHRSEPVRCLAAASLSVQEVAMVHGELDRQLAGYVLDRKSTRLNSSHRCISYAVFCLKKKK